MTSSPSSKTSTEPPQQLLTLPSRVGTFLLEDWNTCVAWSPVETSCSHPVAIDSDIASASHCTGFPLLLPRCISRRPFWSPTCQIIGSHTFNSTTWLLEIGSTLPSFLSRTTLSHPNTTTITTTTPFYPGVKQW